MSWFKRLLPKREHLYKEDEKGVRYWRNVALLDKEELLLTQEWQPSFFFNTIFWLMAICFTLGLVMPFFWMFRWVCKRNRWMLTNKRLLSRTGIFNRSSTVIKLEDIIDMSIDKPVATQLFGRGVVQIESRSGGEGAEMVIHQQHDPDEVRNQIAAAMSAPKKSKKKEGLPVEEALYQAILKAQGLDPKQDMPRRLREEIFDALLQFDEMKSYQLEQQQRHAERQHTPKSEIG